MKIEMEIKLRNSKCCYDCPLVKELWDDEKSIYRYRCTHYNCKLTRQTVLVDFGVFVNRLEKCIKENGE